MILRFLTFPTFCRQLIISKIPKQISTYSIEVHDSLVRSFSSRQLDNFIVAHRHVEEVLRLPRSSTWEIVKQCKGKICCEFSMQYHHQANEEDKVENRLAYNYKLTTASTSSRQIAAGTGSKNLICALIACTSDRRQSCGKRFSSNDNKLEESSLKFTVIRIRMMVEVETSEHDYLIMPINLNTALLPISVHDFKFARISTFTYNR